MIIYLKATLAFLKTLLNPRPPIAAYSVNGHSILKGWDRVPEEDLLVRAAKKSQADLNETSRLGLYSYEGPHAGEVFLMGKPIEQISRASSADVVLTSEKVKSRENYQMQLNGSTVLTAQQGASYRLNGSVETQSELFDYDELELLDNRFLVLDLMVGKQR